MLEHNDAALIIGDPAMKIPRDKLRVFDLGALWHDFTGFGFVFAMWMTRTILLNKRGRLISKPRAIKASHTWMRLQLNTGTRCRYRPPRSKTT